MLYSPANNDIDKREEKAYFFKKHLNSLYFKDR
jgi:hypothetical protein